MTRWPRDADRDLAEILRELDADLARQEAGLRQRRARLAQLLRQAEAGAKPCEQAPVSPGLAELFDRMARLAAEQPGPEPAMAAKDRDLMALLETASPARGTGWLDVLTRTLNSDPRAAERAYAVYARLDELVGCPADDPRVEATAQAIAGHGGTIRGKSAGGRRERHPVRSDYAPGRPGTRTACGDTREAGLALAGPLRQA